jgi:hypothetical protein
LTVHDIDIYNTWLTVTLNRISALIIIIV